MSRRIRHHVNPLSEQYLAFTPKVPRLFAPVVEVELGCAEGEFLFRRARACPGHQLIGVEIRRDLVALVNRRQAVEPCGSVTAVFANMNIHISTLFPQESVDRFFLNFPDPWFKKQHRKRRVMSLDLLEQLLRALKPGGELFFQSDIFELSLDAMSLMEEFGPPRLSNSVEPWSFLKENPYGVPTRREAFVTKRGGSVWRVLYTASPSCSS